MGHSLYTVLPIFLLGGEIMVVISFLTGDDAFLLGRRGLFLSFLEVATLVKAAKRATMAVVVKTDMILQGGRK
jgi:hypothetical protein